MELIDHRKMRNGRHQQQPLNPSLCRRCQLAGPSVTVRKEPLCVSCFSKYVQTKVFKRMDAFRVRYAEPGNEPTLLLALSLGLCSVAMLHILSDHLKRQAERSGRVGFKLCVLHVADSDADQSAIWDSIRSRYPGHEYLMLPLASFAADDDIKRIFPKQPIMQDRALSGSAKEPSGDTSINQLLETLPSPTARADAIRILRRRFIVRTARERGCEAVLWGDSTTRLAERTLAETAKGRGFALPWVMADGETPHGVHFYFPLRDLLSGEVSAYVSLLDPPVANCVLPDDTKVAVSAKNTTIDDLMKQYFDSVEREYPSIVTNVVRTTSKLQPPSLNDIEQQCELCEMPLAGNGPADSRICYGCIRTLPPASSEMG